MLPVGSSHCTNIWLGVGVLLPVSSSLLRTAVNWGSVAYVVVPKYSTRKRSRHSLSSGSYNSGTRERPSNSQLAGGETSASSRMVGARSFISTGWVMTCPPLMPGTRIIRGMRSASS